MKKRIESILLVLVLVLTMLPLTAFAENAGDGSDENPYQIGDVVISNTEPTGAAVQESQWVRTDHEAEYELTCTNTSRQHRHRQSAGCYRLVKEAYTSWTLEVRTYTLSITAETESGSALAYTDVRIYSADGTLAATVQTNGRGTATAELPNGQYTLELNAVSGSSLYTGEAAVRIASADAAVTITAKYSQSLDAYERTYYNTTYFDHVDIRVYGTYTTGTTVDLTTYNIKLADVRISVKNPSGYSEYDFTESFTDTTNYEWRETGIRVYKGASVTLTCDIYDSATGEMLVDEYTYVFYDGIHNGTDYGSTEFVKAIEQCDNRQGLDFIINPQEIIEAVFYEVHYDWDVVDANGSYIGELPEGIATLPAEQTGFESGDSVTIDSHYVEGRYVIDEVNGKIYTFDGWDWWSHEGDSSLKQHTIGTDETTLTVTDDTIIYGVWTVSDLALAESHITITKKFVDSEGTAMTAPEGYHVQVTGPQGGVMEIPITQFDYDAGTGVYSYKLPVYTEGAFTVTEYAFAVSGYTPSASVNVTESAAAVASGHTHLTEIAGNGDTAVFTVDLDYATGSACAEVGEVNFVNSYTKVIGDAAYDYPDMVINKLDADGRGALEGAVFTMTQGDSTLTAETNESGFAYFHDLTPGTWTLTETGAPEGYLAGYAEYRVKVAVREGYPVEQMLNGAWRMYYAYDITVEYTIDGGNTWMPSNHLAHNAVTDEWRLTAFNEKLAGQLTLTKTFTGVDADHYPASVTVSVTKPDGSRENVLLSAANNWTATLTGLELGTYRISETGSQIEGYNYQGVTYNGSSSGIVVIDEEDVPSGYDRDDPVAVQKVTLNNTYEKNESSVDVLPNLTVAKFRDGTDILLAGAQFTLTKTDSDGNGTLWTLTTGPDGEASFENLQPGFYTLQETGAPEGYTADSAVYNVAVYLVKTEEKLENGEYVTYNTYDAVVFSGTWDEGHTVHSQFDENANELDVSNKKAGGQLTVVKTFGVSNAYVPESIEVTVAGPDGYTKTVTLSAANNWTVTLTDLAFGTYTVTESDAATAVDGHPIYSGDTVSQVTVTLQPDVVDGVDGSIGTAALRNTYTREVINPASFQIRKVDADTEDLIHSSAVFTLYSDKDCTQVVAAVETGVDGIATFYGFAEAGTYYLQETKAPLWYALDDTVWTVKVSLENGEPVVQVNRNSHIWETIYNWIAGVESDHWEDGVLTVPNKRLLGDLTVTKSVEDEYGQYADTEYAITVDFTDDSFDTTLTLGDGESETIENIPYGTKYTVTEEHTGAAFVGAVENGTGTITEETASVQVRNVYTYEDVNTVVRLLKVNALTDAVVEGAGFTLYADEDLEEIVCEGESDEDGVVILDAAEPGTYYLQETTAPDGYYADDTVYIVVIRETYTVKNPGTSDAYTERCVSADIEGLTSIGEEDETAFIVENTPILPVVIRVEKQWVLNGGVQPESVEVTLYRNGEAYDTAELSEENGWRYIWETGLTDEYVWTVDEPAVPAGYAKTVTREGNDFTIVNTRNLQPVEITVKKVWVGRNVDHPDAIGVTLYRNGEAYGNTVLNEENNWTYTWTGLSNGDIWTVDETAVPEGYTRTVTQDGNTFVITNTHADIPDTGDSSALGLWAVMAAIGLAGLGFTMVLAAGRKKKNSR